MRQSKRARELRLALTKKCSGARWNQWAPRQNHVLGPYGSYWLGLCPRQCQDVS